jgi:DNA mismatch repair protein MutL
VGKIVQLNDQLSNKIAAGEVVERPSSVVKELVENAIDANGKKIEIHIEEAGLSKISVIDNGDGIEADDCLIAFARHATSKIKDENDLFRIRTLGFRGEALPSIASVAEVELKTSTGNGPGRWVIIKGGKLAKNEPANSRKGTEITVSQLFYNTPARLKHLKTFHTELGNITDIVNRIAMAHPEISIRLLHNGKQLLYTNGNGDGLQVLAAIYGIGIAKKMVTVSAESIDFTVKGYIAKPEVTRASRNYISVIINGRYIKNYPLAKAIQQGYHTLLPIGRYPVCFFEITMDPHLVDVNVHPSKLEVRLSKENELTALIENAIKDAFRHQALIPEVKKRTERSAPSSRQENFQFEFREQEKINKVKEEEFKSATMEESYKTKPYEARAVQNGFEGTTATTTTVGKADPFAADDKQKMEWQQEPASKNNEGETEITELTSTIENQKQQVERIPPLFPIGQMHGTYILAQNENGLYLVDQHAAQERMKYEYFLAKVGEVEPMVQELLVPLTLEYSQREAIILEEYKEELEKVGVFLENFGPQSFIVRSHPQWFPKGEEAETIEEIIEQVLHQKKVSITQLREEAAIMMSCKGSIKANHHLRNDEIFALLDSLRLCKDPFTCPHGRPIIIHFSTYEIEKMFKRVM